MFAGERVRDIQAQDIALINSTELVHIPAQAEHP
jgi:hypothetical protein